MTDEHLKAAAKMMASAYRAGYDQKPAPADVATHALLEMQYQLGRRHAAEGKRSDFWMPYGVGPHGS